MEEFRKYPKDSLIIAVDFDGTVVTHEYPKIGKDIGAVPVLKRLTDTGHRLILWTMRSGTTLDEAIKWFSDNGIELWGVNKNPEQYTWTDSPKAYANYYIDDAAIGIPLDFSEISDRVYVDWKTLEKNFWPIFV